MVRKAAFSFVSVLVLIVTACASAATPAATSAPAATTAPSSTTAPAATSAPGSPTAPAANSGAPQKGGTLTVAYKDDLATLLK